MKLNPAEKFFYKHAGFSYDPKTQTRKQGREQSAVKYAEAESIAQRKVALGEWRYTWAEDWNCGSHIKEFGYDAEPETCEFCALATGDGQMILASLGCIDDATPDYRRVIEAELALEAL